MSTLHRKDYRISDTALLTLKYSLLASYPTHFFVSEGCLDPYRSFRPGGILRFGQSIFDGLNTDKLLR